jgi:hypothetical protein
LSETKNNYDSKSGKENTIIRTSVATVVSLLTILTGTILLALNFNFFWLAYPIGFDGILSFAIMIKNYDTQVGENESETFEKETAKEYIERTQNSDNG